MFLPTVQPQEGCVDSALDDATSSRGVRAAGRRAAMLAAAAGGAPAVAEEPKMLSWKRNWGVWSFDWGEW
jgi:hypothetical protein